MSDAANPEEAPEAAAVSPAAPVAVPAPEREAEPAAASPPLLPRTSTLRAALRCGLLFGSGGAIIALRSAAQQTLPHILVFNSATDFQEVQDGLPVPRLLDWNVTQITALQFLADMNFILLALGTVLLWSVLLLCAVSALNPTFSLIQKAKEGEKRTLFHIAFDGTPIGKMLRAVQVPALAFLVVWVGTDRFTGRLADFTVELRLVALGIALWTAFHRYGIAGNFTRRELQSLRGAASELVVTGAGFGLAVYIASQIAFVGPLVTLLDRYQMLGTFHRGYWYFIVGRAVLSSALVWCGAGILLTALARPLRVPARIAYLALVLLVFSAGYSIQRPLRPDVYVKRLDMTPEVRDTIAIPYTPRIVPSGVPQGQPAARELAARVPAIPFRDPAKSPDHSLLLFTPKGPANTRQAGTTQDGLPLDNASLPAVRDFLEQRHYQTALAWTAIRHLYNVHVSAFDTTAAIGDLLTDLTRCPSLLQCDETLVTMLTTCAASPQNLALLDQFADTRQFAFPDRESRRLMGNLYRRFGESEKALVWYRRAEMPKTFLKRITADRPMFHTGRISGTLRFNGKPLAGVRIAAQPFQMNGLPPTLAPNVFNHLPSLLGTRGPFLPLFPPYHPVPYEFRWISAGATTDAEGHFTLNDLIDGAYWLLLRLPDGVLLAPPTDPALHCDNAPKLIPVNYDHPAQNLGTIVLTYAPQSRTR